MGWFSKNDTQASTQFGYPTGMGMGMGMGAGAGMGMDPTMMMMQQSQNPMMQQGIRPNDCHCMFASTQRASRTVHYHTKHWTCYGFSRRGGPTFD